MERQQEANIILAEKTSFKYKAKTVPILNKKPKAANNIENFSTLILLLRLINWLFHSGGVCFSNTYSSWIFLIKLLKV